MQWLQVCIHPTRALVNNTFFDRDRNDFIPWVIRKKLLMVPGMAVPRFGCVAEQQKMLSASFYWVASEAAIKDTRPSYYYVYNEKIDIHNRIAAVVQWLKLAS
jgi:hypothetical protein